MVPWFHRPKTPFQVGWAFSATVYGSLKIQCEVFGGDNSGKKSGGFAFLTGTFFRAWQDTDSCCDSWSRNFNWRQLETGFRRETHQIYIQWRYLWRIVIVRLPGRYLQQSLLPGQRGAISNVTSVNNLSCLLPCNFSFNFFHLSGGFKTN